MKSKSEAFRSAVSCRCLSISEKSKPLFYSNSKAVPCRLVVIAHLSALLGHFCNIRSECQSLCIVTDIAVLQSVHLHAAYTCMDGAYGKFYRIAKVILSF